MSRGFRRIIAGDLRNLNATRWDMSIAYVGRSVEYDGLINPLIDNKATKWERDSFTQN